MVTIVDNTILYMNVAKSRYSEKAMATHSGVLAWRILGTVEPGGLPSMGSHRVGHDWSDLAAAAAAAAARVGLKESYHRGKLLPCVVINVN